MPMSTMATTVAPIDWGIGGAYCCAWSLTSTHGTGSLLSVRKFYEVEKIRIRPVAIKAAPKK